MRIPIVDMRDASVKMTQAPISIDGKEVIDLSLRNSIREVIDETIEIGIRLEDYARLLSYRGDLPGSIDCDENTVTITATGKYRYIYTEGGHMVAHTDTIKGPGHIGTLVIIEQRAEKGGHLLLGEGEYEKDDAYIEEFGDEDEEPSTIMNGEYYFDHNVHDGEYRNCLSAIIPINVLHEVTKVRKGTRISRVYDLFVDEATLEPIDYYDLETEKMDLSPLVPMITEGTWDRYLAEKYTKGNRFLVYPHCPDLIESLILKMILSVYKPVKMTQALVRVRNGNISYHGEDCTLIGELEDCIHSYSSYNDHGTDTISYHLVNLLEIEKDTHPPIPFK